MRASLRRSAVVSLAALLASAATGCADDPTAPGLGSIRVDLTSSGVEVDPNGYRLVIDGADAASVGTSGVVVIDGVRAGDRELSVADLASNCDVEGEHPRTVRVVPNETAEVEVAVACVARVGALRVSMTTTGSDIDPDGYLLTVSGDADAPVAAPVNGAVTITNLREGQVSVTLTGLGTNCSRTGTSPIVANVVFGQTADVAIAVICVARVGTLRVTVATTGEELDEDGYFLIVNGDDYSAVAVPVNGAVALPNVHEGDVTLALTGIVSNCAAGPASPAPHVAFAQTTEVTISVLCAATGSIRVRTATVGADPPAGFGVTLRRVGAGAVDGRMLAPSGEATFAKLSGGDYDVAVADSPENCTVAGAASRRVTVRVRETVDIAYDITCVAARLLVFSMWNDGTDDIAVAKSTGEGLAWVTGGPANDVGPEWSPDGTRIAFSSTRDGAPDIYVMNADGSGVARLTSAAGADSSPTWSPDGTRIAFVSARDGNDEIYVMNADGSSQARLTTHAAPDADPAWSRDGARIAFRSHRDGDAEIHVMNADGSGVVALTSDPAWDGQPAWSPDGTRIAYISDDCLASCYYSTTRLLVLSVVGAGLPGVVLQLEGLHDPAWSPDGGWIAVATLCAYYCYDGLLLVRPESGATRSVVGGRVGSPSWRQ